MALWPNVILLIDAQERILIWIGRDVVSLLSSSSSSAGDDGIAAGKDLSHDSLTSEGTDGTVFSLIMCMYVCMVTGRKEAEKVMEACHAYASKVRQERHPVPSVLEIKEGDPMERFLLAIVIPSHKDSPATLNER